jgi:hypothetical protein
MEVPKTIRAPAAHNRLAREMLHKAVIVPSGYAKFSPCGGGTSDVSISIRILAKRNLIPVSTVFEESGDTTQGQVFRTTGGKGKNVPWDFHHA